MPYGNPIIAPKELPVHESAAAYPMLKDDELAELADSIAINGLLQSIMLNSAGDLLIDGRNRLAACRLAGIEPRFERLTEGVDEEAYILAVNAERRHLTASQKAMATALAYPDPAKRGRGNKIFPGETFSDVDKGGLSKARVVLRFSPELARAVMHDELSLKEAYERATQHEREKRQREEFLGMLRVLAPDIADLVEREQYPTELAVQRLRRRRFDHSIRLIDAVEAADQPMDMVSVLPRLFDRDVEIHRGSVRITAERLRRAGEFLTALAAVWGADI